jgi:hypothetical protein
VTAGTLPIVSDGVPSSSVMVQTPIVSPGLAKVALLADVRTTPKVSFGSSTLSPVTVTLTIFSV